ncbi:hypothetical protein V496_02459 [Pseudogymnoascus sp. VKM F-4515 (FW-2607)]|nr:hypothetical protein V496_02459 [Pseudogymnoascus sp. VKM F-4515 (FW-2607)]KFY85209.1 hypothetical protein V498_07748 [Pseudogymnoascus sp. VKM F-4517 (FW-2822)]
MVLGSAYKEQARAGLKNESEEVAEIVETLVEALNKRKRQRLNKVGSSRSPEWYKAIAKELIAKPSNLVAIDKSDIEQELRLYATIVERGACVSSRGVPNRPLTRILPVNGQGASIGELEFGTS